MTSKKVIDESYSHSETRLANGWEKREFRKRSLHYVPATPTVPRSTEKVLSKADLAKAMSERLAWVFDYLDRETLTKKMEVSSLKDIMIAAAVGIDKLLLATDQPTNIVSTKERKELDELAPALLAELTRRGKTVKVTERTAEIRVDEPRALPRSAG